jgi:hypothetical protein
MSDEREALAETAELDMNAMLDDETALLPDSPEHAGAVSLEPEEPRQYDSGESERAVSAHQIARREPGRRGAAPRDDVG